MNPDCDVTFVVYEGLVGNPVVEGQVLELAKELLLRGCRVEVIAFERADVWLRSRGARARMVAQFCQSPNPGSLRFYPRLAGVAGMRLARRIVSGRLSRHSVKVVQARGMKAGWVSSGRPKGCALVLDMRAAEPEEVASAWASGESTEWLLRIRSESEAAHILEAIEREAVFAADGVLCVSHALERHLRAKYPDLRVSAVAHCAADRGFSFREDERRSIREKLGVGPEVPLFGYVGGLCHYHRPAHLGLLVRAIAEVQPSSAFLFITGSVNQARALAQNAGVLERTTVVSAPRTEIPGLLSACDFGLMAIGDDTRDRVCFPVKYSEYACVGLPVITTDGPADLRELHDRLTGGALIGWGLLDASVREGCPADALRAELAGVLAAHASDRTARAAAAARELRWDQLADEVLAFHDWVIASSADVRRESCMMADEDDIDGARRAWKP